MNYPSMKKSSAQSKTIRFSGGITSGTEKNHIPDDHLSSGLNVLSKNGILRARNGIVPKTDTVIGNYDNNGSIIKDLTITETEIFRGGSRQKIAYTVWGNELFEDIHIYLVSPKGEFETLYSIHLTPENNYFYRFENVFFTVGKRTCGSGIYAFVKRGCIYNYAKEYTYEIYEYDTDIDGYHKLQNSDFYTPVIYINGRGSEYDRAKQIGWVFSGSPACPEEINLLGGRFCAYFSSDGVSTSFKLPVSGLDFGSEVICRIYDSTNAYTEWYVDANTFEKTVSFCGQQVKLNCDRISGLFSFYVGNEPYSIPNTRILNGNNICFIAVKKLTKSKEKIIGSKSVKEFNSGFYVYGNDESKNEIYASKYETPLYFPETMKTAVGTSTDAIISLKNHKGDLIAFKSEGIFKITSAGEAGKLSYISPVGITSDFSKPARLSCSVINSGYGPTSEKTVCKCAENFVWINNRKVCSFGKSNDIKELSQPVNSILSSLTDEEISNAFATSFDGLYFLFFGHKALVLNYQNESFGVSEKYTSSPQNNKNIAWFYLEFPEETIYSSAFCTDENMFLICKDQNDTINYLSTFGGDKDIILESITPNEVLSEKPINFTFTTKTFDFDVQKPKNIISLNLQMSGNSVVLINVTGDNYTSNQSVKLRENVTSDIKVFPFFMPITRMGFKISGEAPFSLPLANIEYNI